MLENYLFIRVKHDKSVEEREGKKVLRLFWQGDSFGARRGNNKKENGFSRVSTRRKKKKGKNQEKCENKAIS